MKKIRTDILKESIAEYTNMAQSIKENASDIVQSMLQEAVANEYAKILAEDFAKEDDEENDKKDNNEVKDTEPELETESFYSSEETDNEESDDSNNEEDDSEDGWEAEYEDLKVEDSDDTYDFSKADDETLVKVYKRLTDSDEIAVKMDKSSNKLEIKDNSTGAEYVIDLELDDEENDTCNGGECTFEITSDEEDNDINESKQMIEIVLNEDANLGYTTKYQKQDAMTTPPMTEPGKNVNDWDAGVPKGKERPYGTKKTKTTPFTEEEEMEIAEEENIPVKPVEKWGVNSNAKGDKYHNIDKTWDQKPSKKNASTWGLQSEAIDECGFMDEEEDLEEATNVGGAVQQRSKSKSHVPNGRKNYGPYTKHGVSTTENGYEGDVTESMRRKHNKIMRENRELKETLSKLYGMMTEAQVTNTSIGLMNKLMTENTVAQDEKKEIYKRFNEVKTVNEAKTLYKQIERELQRKDKMNINEDKQFTVENSNKINENTIYASKDLLASLNLMHKIC